MDGTGGPAPEKRIGDRERREVDDRLQQAHADGVLTLTEYDERSAQCWAARTRTELEALTHDLPDPAPRAPVAAAPAVRPQAPLAARGRRTAIGAALLGVALFGSTQVATASDASAVFGSQVVQVAPDQDRVDVGVLFGNVEVVVPDDARVGTSGTILFGNTDCDAACDGTGTRVINVDASGGFGNVDVVRQGERASRDDDRRDRNGGRGDDRDDDRDDD